jgi:hemoglobin-like flavoprotein
MGITRHPLYPDHDRDGDVPIDAAILARLETSFALLAPQIGRVAHDFYTILFTRHPEVRAMFPADMAAQELKLSATLAFVVEHLRSPAAVTARMAELGALHHALHVKPEQYPLVCDAIVAAMAQHSPTPMSPELERDWRRALQLVSLQMLRGARAPR